MKPLEAGNDITYVHYPDLPHLLVTCGFDMLHDVAHAYAKKLADAGTGALARRRPGDGARS